MINTHMATVYLALGTNLNDRAAALQAAVNALSAWVHLLACSPVYETDPWGFTDQPPFLNQVVCGQTQLSPEDLLATLKKLETNLGRTPTFHYGPRAIDIDILMYDNQILDTPTLVLPHPLLHKRAFVLVPFADIAPDEVHPRLKKTVGELLNEVDQTGVELFEKGVNMNTKITWYGHSTLGLETGGYHLLIDPFFTGNPAAPVSADAVKADFILVTHGHDDHIGDTIAIAKRTGATVISNFEIAGWLEKQGVKTHAQHIGGGHQHPFGYLKLTLALHGSCLPDGSYGGNPAGFLLTTQDEKKLYLAGDTGLFGDMRLIGEEGLRLAVIPIGDNFTMGPDDALRAIKMLQPEQVIPIHFGTWDVIKQNASAWAKQVQAETKTLVTVLKPGETYNLDN